MWVKKKKWGFLPQADDHWLQRLKQTFLDDHTCTNLHPAALATEAILSCPRKLPSELVSLLHYPQPQYSKPAHFWLNLEPHTTSQSTASVWKHEGGPYKVYIPEHISRYIHFVVYDYVVVKVGGGGTRWVFWCSRCSRNELKKKMKLFMLGLYVLW